MFLGHVHREISPTGVVAGALLAGLLGGCETRDRLTFGDGSGDGTGPVTTITRPGVDTTVQAGPGVVVQGTSQDPDGVDTFYALVIGGVTTFPPFPGNGPVFIFDLPITTNGQSGQIITLRLYATDELGNRGDTVIRQITVQ